MKKVEKEKSNNKHLLFNIPQPLGSYQWYVDEMKRGIDNPKVLNIALSGGYGSGKSSIIELYERNNSENKNKKVIRKVSLLSISNKNKELDDNYTTRKRIQSEIIKQLFFGEMPERLPFSKYRRISTVLGYIILVVTSIVFATCAYVWFWGKIIDYRVDTLLVTSINIGIVIVSMSVGYIITSFLSKYYLKIFSVGDLSIELNDNKLDFDQMTDELIYYFSSTRTDILIIEDIDRLNNIEIYEDLRQLNFLLNNSKGIKQKVTFIYAVKDSLIGESRDRAKVFDLIVPVVPFTSLDNSENIIRNSLIAVGLEKYLKNEKILRHASRLLVEKRQINLFVNYLIAYDLMERHRSDFVDKDDYVVTTALIRTLSAKEYDLMLDGNGHVDKLFKEAVEVKNKELVKAKKAYNNSKNIDDIIKNNSELIFNEFIERGRNIFNNVDGSMLRFVDDDNNKVDTAYINSVDNWNNIIKGTRVYAVYSNTKRCVMPSDLTIDAGISSLISDIMDYLRNGYKYYESELLEINNKNVWNFLSVDSLNKEQIDLSVKQLIENCILDENYRLCLIPYDMNIENQGVLIFKDLLKQGLSQPYQVYTDKTIKELIDKYIIECDYSNDALLNITFIDYVIEKGDDDFVYNVIQKQYKDNKKHLFDFYLIYYYEHVNEPPRNEKMLHFTELMLSISGMDFVQFIIDNNLLAGNLRSDILKPKIFEWLANCDEKMSDEMKQFFENNILSFEEESLNENIIKSSKRHGIYIHNVSNVGVLEKTMAKEGLFIINERNVEALLDVNILRNAIDVQFDGVLPLKQYSELLKIRHRRGAQRRFWSICYLSQRIMMI